MDQKNLRSSMRKSVCPPEEKRVQIASLALSERAKRRISFCGKNSVREFHHEEEPKAWENSYEVSDHLTSDETGSTLHSGQKSDIHLSYNSTIMSTGPSTDRQVPQLIITENKENIPKMSTNVDDLRLKVSMDGLEMDSASRLSGSLHLEHSLDITLFDSEKSNKRRSLNKLRPSNERVSDGFDIRNIVSFTLCDHELNQFNRSSIDKEETINFMHKTQMESKMEMSFTDTMFSPNEKKVSENIEAATKNDNFANVTMEMSPIQKNVINDEKKQLDSNVNKNIPNNIDSIKTNQDLFAPPKVIRRVITGAGAFQKKRIYNKNSKKIAESTGVEQAEVIDKNIKTEENSKSEKNDDKPFIDQLDFSLIHSSEYEVGNLKQLNDAIERGKIQVYPEGTPRTPIPPKRVIDKMTIGAQTSSRRALDFDDDNLFPVKNILKTNKLSEFKGVLEEKKNINISDLNDKSSFSLMPPNEDYLKEQSDLNESVEILESPVLEDNCNPVSMLLDTRLHDNFNDVSMEENHVFAENTNYMPMDLDETITNLPNIINVIDETKKLDLNQSSKNIDSIQQENSKLFEENLLLKSEKVTKSNRMLVNNTELINNTELKDEQLEIDENESTNLETKSLEDKRNDIFSNKDVDNIEIEYKNDLLKKRRPTIYFEDDIDIDNDKTFYIPLKDKDQLNELEKFNPTNSEEKLHKTMYFEEDIDESTICNDKIEVTSPAKSENGIYHSSNTANRKTVYIYEPIADITLPVNNNDVASSDVFPTNTEANYNVNILDIENKKTDKSSQNLNTNISTNNINESFPVIENINYLEISNIFSTNQSIVKNKQNRRETIYNEMSMDLSMCSSDDMEIIDDNKKSICEVIIQEDNINDSNQEENLNELQKTKKMEINKSVVEAVDVYQTPNKDSDNQQRLKNLYCQTPSQSVMEFLEIERHIATMEDKNNTSSFAISNNGIKRLSVNLTPHMQPGKKVQNMSLYKISTMEETLIDNKTLNSEDKKENSTLLEADLNESKLSNTIAHNQTEDFDSKKSIYVSEINLMEDNLNENTLSSGNYKDNYINNSYVGQIINLDSSSSSEDDDDIKDQRCEDLVEDVDLNDMNQSNLLKSMQMPRRYTVNDQTLQYALKLPETLELNEDIDKINMSFNNDFKYFNSDDLLENKYEERNLSGTEKMWRRIRESLPAKSIDASKMCRTCRYCRKSLENEHSIIDGKIELPAVPSMAEMVGLDRLKKMPKKYLLADIDGLWRSLELKSLDRTSLNSEDTFKNVGSEVYRNDLFIKNYCENFPRLKNNLEISKNIPLKRTFIEQLTEIIRKFYPKWIFDNQMERRGILLMHHRDVLTFSLKILFKETDYFGTNICIRSVTQCERIPEKKWYTIDYILHFQCKLEIPFEKINLKGYKTINDLMDWLKLTDEAFAKVIKSVKELQRAVLCNNSMFLREDNRNYICKNIRQVVPNGSSYDHVETVQFKINVYNIQNLSFPNISMPPLHRFCEEVHKLPIGIDFVNAFLSNPLIYLRNPTIQSEKT